MIISKIKLQKFLIKIKMILIMFYKRYNLNNNINCKIIVFKIFYDWSVSKSLYFINFINFYLSKITL